MSEKCEFSEDKQFHTVPLRTMLKPVRLFDEKEDFKFVDVEELVGALGSGLGEERGVMVVSIIGRTGDGKSHLLNEAFFHGACVFETDAGQDRCTTGAWAALYEDKHNEKDDQSSPPLLLIDTEGLQGRSDHAENRQRMLMKVMAVSDMVVYRTKDSRIGQDVFNLIADTWLTFDRYFMGQLSEQASQYGCKVQSLAPAFMLVHSLEFTSAYDSADQILDIIKNARPDKTLNVSNLFYVHYKSNKDDLKQIDYQDLRNQIVQNLRSVGARAPRSCQFVLNCMLKLNETFNSEIREKPGSVFPDEFFSCRCECSSCFNLCELAMRHPGRHRNSKKQCSLSHKLENFLYLCKMCSNRGEERVLVPKPVASKESLVSGTLGYFWRGFVLECDQCGVIFKSRQYWYGNDSPESAGNVIRRVVHAWPGEPSAGHHPIAQRWSDSLSDVSAELTALSTPALRAVKDGIVDACRPDSRMQNNSDVHACPLCNRSLDSLFAPLHHCRQCFRGVCDTCSQHTLTFPGQNGTSYNQRVCNECYEESKKGDFQLKSLPEDMTSYQAYKIFEKTYGLLGTVARTPLNVAKLVARPSYWRPDSECTKCQVCNNKFVAHWNPVHHCRACGAGVCDSCSGHRLYVPLRGIDSPQRVCNTCEREQLHLLPSGDSRD